MNTPKTIPEGSIDPEDAPKGDFRNHFAKEDAERENVKGWTMSKTSTDPITQPEKARFLQPDEHATCE